MKEIPVSKFKATCLSVLAEVGRTGIPVRVTRFGKPLADIVAPVAPKKKSWLGSMRDAFEITGDIVGPIGAFDNWEVREP